MVKKTKVTSILDAPPEVLEKYLARTGETREQVEARLKALDEDLANSPAALEGCDPALKDKFTADPGFDVIE